ncbi:hypothetical protein ACEQ8H_006672 [Pleosporales sp. CAS-2024a]
MPLPSTHYGRRNPAAFLFWPILVSNIVLSALSIANLGLISSMVGFLLDQKHHVHSYEVNSPGLTFSISVEPAHLWVNQGHTSNGVAGYGFFLGLFGIFVAWRVRRAASPSVLATALLVLQLLAVLFTLSALIFVFVVTNQTKGQKIQYPIAANNQGQNYPDHKWTPETWFKAVLDLPLAHQEKHDEIASKVTNMVAWRWMLIPILVADVIAFGVTTLAWLRLRKGNTVRPGSADVAEK